MPAAPAAPQKPAPAPAAEDEDQDQPSRLGQRWAERQAGRQSAGAEGAGAILALFLYPLLVNALKGGPAQAKGWLAAKFINEPYAGTGLPGRKKAPPPVPKKPGPGPAPRP